MYLVCLMMMGWPPRYELVKGRPRKMSLLISLLQSLPSWKYLRLSSQRKTKLISPLRSTKVPLHLEVDRCQDGSDAWRIRIHTRHLPGSKQPEEEMSTPQREAALLTGMKEEDLFPKRYETFTMDYDWVQQVRGSLLGVGGRRHALSEGYDTSELFIPRAAALEPEPPEVVAAHWLPILREHGHLMECHPDKFTAAADWVPLYIPDSLWRHLPVALYAFVTTKLPSLIAVVHQ